MTRTTSYLLKSAAALSAALAFCVSGSAQSIVYDNSTGWLTDPTPRLFAATNGVEYGDEIILAGTDRVLTDLKLDYFLSASASGNETVTITLYANDGPAAIANPRPGEANAPGTVLGTATTALTTSILGYNVLTYTPTTMTVLPDRFTYAVQINGLEGTEQAGLLISYPTNVGNDLADFWLKSGGTWNLYVDPAYDPNMPNDPANLAKSMNFSARVTAVPEPTTIAYAFLAGLISLGFWARKRRAA